MTTGTCAFCGAQIDIDALLDHLRDAHGITEPLQTWPDGRPVIIDETLTPEDFA